MKREKGSALITVILVVLVLTMVGIAGLFFMTTEDRISGVDKMQKVALYGAESGLRVGENIVTQGNLAAMLTYGQTAYNTYLPPGGGYRAVVLTNSSIPAHTDLALQISDPSNGGISVPATECRGIQVPNYEGFTCTYSVYIRNNSDDPAGATTDSDRYANIVAVGTVATAVGQVVQKVLEEQYYWGSNAVEPTQHRFGPSGTSSSQYQ
jgi:hypothetical protein